MSDSPDEQNSGGTKKPGGHIFIEYPAELMKTVIKFLDSIEAVLNFRLTCSSFAPAGLIELTDRLEKLCLAPSSASLDASKRICRHDDFKGHIKEVVYLGDKHMAHDHCRDGSIGTNGWEVAGALEDGLKLLTNVNKLTLAHDAAVESIGAALNKTPHSGKQRTLLDWRGMNFVCHAATTRANAGHALQVCLATTPLDQIPLQILRGMQQPQKPLPLEMWFQSIKHLDLSFTDTQSAECCSAWAYGISRATALKYLRLASVGDQAVESGFIHSILKEDIRFAKLETLMLERHVDHSKGHGVGREGAPLIMEPQALETFLVKHKDTLRQLVLRNIVVGDPSTSPFQQATADLPKFGKWVKPMRAMFSEMALSTVNVIFDRHFEVIGCDPLWDWQGQLIKFFAIGGVQAHKAFRSNLSDDIEGTYDFGEYLKKT